MGSLRDIRNRIRSVKNTKKITGAMKLVAASKLRRAQDAITQQRPYALEIGALLHRVAARSVANPLEAPHPLLVRRPVKRALLVVITSDRGLCGAFNASILRRARSFVAEHAARLEHLDLMTIGRRGHEGLQGEDEHFTLRNEAGVFEALTFRKAVAIADRLVQAYQSDELDAVYVLYNEFKSAIAQDLVLETVLPVNPDELPEGEAGDYLYEPSEADVLEDLLPRYVATQVWRALLESQAAEHGARMTAMDSATKNAGELIDSLTLQYNRARQAAITMDLMDIVGGAEALQQG